MSRHLAVSAATKLSRSAISSPMTLTARIKSLAQRDALTGLGIALSIGWLVLLMLFWFLAPGGDGGSGGIARLVSAVGVVLPLVLVWIAIGLARAITILRAEADDLHQSLGRLREYAATRGAPPITSGGGDMQRPGPDPKATARPAKSEPNLPARPAAQQPTPQRGRPGDQRQAAMRFDSPESVSVPNDTLIRAMNFPDGPDDAEAIAALRMALKDHDTSRVLRAAQDVVTLLAGQDIYMDDFPPDTASPAVWRRFGDGARGSAVASLGAIHDETALEVTSALLRSDEIFRDTAHHFLRHFDILLTRILSQLDDDQIMALSETRSSRAFMVVGRVAGIFG